MTYSELASVTLLMCGAFFFFAGTVGLLRFPDVYTRLHALTKADNLGLGFVIAGLAVEADSLVTIGKLGIIWLLVLGSSSVSCQLIARVASDGVSPPWKRS